MKFRPSIVVLLLACAGIAAGAWFDYIRFNYRGKLFHLTTERERKIKRISDEINEKTGTAVKSITEGIEELKDSFRK